MTEDLDERLQRWTVTELVDLARAGRLRLDGIDPAQPPLDDLAACRAVEKTILGLLLPDACVTETEAGWTLVAGGPTLLALLRFADPEATGERQLRLVGTEYRTLMEGCVLADLPSHLRDRFLSHRPRIWVLDTRARPAAFTEFLVKTIDAELCRP